MPIAEAHLFDITRVIQLAIAPVFRVAGSTFIPAPGWTTLPTTGPTTSARVEKNRK